MARAVRALARVLAMRPPARARASSGTASHPCSRRASNGHGARRTRRPLPRP